MKQKEFLTEIKKLTVQDLRAKGRELAEELMKMRFRKASNQLNETHRLREVRRNLARVETLISQKENTTVN